MRAASTSEANTLTRESNRTLNSTPATAIGTSSGVASGPRAATAAAAITMMNTAATSPTVRSERYKLGRKNASVSPQTPRISVLVSTDPTATAGGTSKRPKSAAQTTATPISMSHRAVCAMIMARVDVLDARRSRCRHQLTGR